MLRSAATIGMMFDPPLLLGRLLRRYKRFLADVELADGRTVTAHCPNTGSMLGCDHPGSRVWLRDSGNQKRKYPFTWELVEALPEVIVGINTSYPNRLVIEALERGLLPQLVAFPHVRREVRLGDSRIDLCLESDEGLRCWVEVKNVTAAVDAGVALFPDAVTARGSRHLDTLRAAVADGDRALMLYCVQRADVTEVRPADAIDPAYGTALRAAIDGGVEACALGADVSPTGIVLTRSLPVVCP